MLKPPAALLRTPIAPADALAKIVYPALAFLPARMGSREAQVLLLAIMGQESGFEYRYQILKGRPKAKGPARGLPQFELGSEAKGGGVWGVFKHAASAGLLRSAALKFNVPPTPVAIWRALEFDDVFACIVARLLLWTDPQPLPAIGNSGAAWEYYLRNWQPGKPHRPRWPKNYDQAVLAVRGETT